MDITQGNLNTVAKEHIATYCDNRLALIDDLHTLGQTNAVRVEFIIAALCIKGRASLYINGEAYTMNEYDLLICHPNIILEKVWSVQTYSSAASACRQNTSTSLQ